MGAFEARRQSPLMSSLLWLLLGVAGAHRDDLVAQRRR